MGLAPPSFLSPPPPPETLLRAGQLLFYCTFVVPPVIFYFFDPLSSDGRFPSTISHQIRRGRPKLAHNAIWLTGWLHVLAALWLSGETLRWKAFALQMIATGVLAIVIYPLGSGSSWRDNAHYLFSLLYMMDHVPLLWHWGMAPRYAAGFTASFCCFLLSMRRMRQLKQAHGVPLGGGSSSFELRQEALALHRADRDQDRDRVRTRSESQKGSMVSARLGVLVELGFGDLHDSERMGSRWRRRRGSFAWTLVWLETAEMVFENALFACFVAGMGGVV